MFIFVLILRRIISGNVNTVCGLLYGRENLRKIVD